MDSSMGLQVTTWMDDITPFCPVEVITGSKVYDGLLDYIGQDGGGFYILTGEAFTEAGAEAVQAGGHAAMLPGQKIILYINAFGKHFHLPCRVRELSFDEEGLFIYAKLKFLAPDGTTQRRLIEYLNSLW